MTCQWLRSSHSLILLLMMAVAAQAAPVRKPSAVKPARRWMKSLTLREKIAQLVFIPFHGAPSSTKTREYRQFARLVQEVQVGGLILVNWSQNRVIQRAEPYALAAFLNRTQKLAKIPLLVSGDFERGASMRVDGTTIFPHAMAFTAAGDPAAARFEGEVTARESRALGVHWVFFPVADVNNNPDNPIINIRSFGESPKDVATYAGAFIEGAHSDPRNRILTTAKHFPGHGDTAIDTHLNLATITADRERLSQVELTPFRAAIAHKVDAVMTAHIAVPALDAPDLPATLSPAILTTLLRGELGFRGLVVTDALEMGGIAKGFSPGEAAVRALEAGADVLLMPPDPVAAVNAVLAAVQHGRLTQKRIEQSVERILAAKSEVGLDRGRLVDVESIGDLVNSPETNQRAQQIADRAVTLVKNSGDMVPLRDPARTCYLVLAESRSSTSGQILMQEIRRRVGGDPVIILVDPSMPELALEDAAQKAASCQSVVIAAFVSVSAYRGDLALAGEFPKLVESVIASGKPVALLALGSPYLLRSFPKVSAYLTTYSTVPLAETAAVKALFGEIAITGRLPVTIPGEARYGDGIQLPARMRPKP